jgi:hypothetical protein
MIACEMYVETDEVDSNGNPKAPKRARIPQRALVWLIETLEAQNGSMEQLEAMNEGAMAEIAQYMGQQQQMPPEAQGQPSQAELLQ